MRERIIELRKRLGFNQTAFAESINISKAFISLYERGERDISDRTISDICRVHNVNEEWLRTGVGVMFSPISREAEIADIVKEMLTGEDTEFILEVTRLMQRMSTEDKELFYKVGKRFVDDKDHPNK